MASSPTRSRSAPAKSASAWRLGRSSPRSPEACRRSCSASVRPTLLPTSAYARALPWLPRWPAISRRGAPLASIPSRPFAQSSARLTLPIAFVATLFKNRFQFRDHLEVFRASSRALYVNQSFQIQTTAFETEDVENHCIGFQVLKSSSSRDLPK